MPTTNGTSTTTGFCVPARPLQGRSRSSWCWAACWANKLVNYSALRASVSWLDARIERSQMSGHRGAHQAMVRLYFQPLSRGLRSESLTNKQAVIGWVCHERETRDKDHSLKSIVTHHTLIGCLILARQVDMIAPQTRDAPQRVKNWLVGETNVRPP